ncbi:hypothetical protein IMSAG185_01849 [Lachnospiraceae bacterium]|jgi:hypothetical protein|nr:hypothetical protein IMSAG185_01849 [Lachnospiraceae bacterium]
MCSQGGINAAKGFYDFKVYPVQVVSRMAGMKSENGGSGRRQQESSGSSAFTEILKKAIADDQPMDCYVVTYNVNKELQTYHYRPTREYTF